MKKPNRFLLATDPRADGGDVAIIHTIDPLAIIGIVHEHVQHAMPFMQYGFTDAQGNEKKYTLYIHHLFTTDFGNMEQSRADLVIEKLLNRAWHWYVSYLHKK